jgi:hypothetical protein
MATDVKYSTLDCDAALRQTSRKRSKLLYDCG